MQDEDLRRAFQELRSVDERRARGFQSLLRRSPGMRAPRGLRLGAAPIALGAIAAVLVAGFVLLNLRHGTPHSHVQSPPDLLTWKAPTDFLLETPGSELLRSVPQLIPTEPAPRTGPSTAPKPPVRIPEKSS